ncbi:MAG TPA: hypothetical protein VGL95_04580 [Acetobacteraceae bacterium]
METDVAGVQRIHAVTPDGLRARAERVRMLARSVAHDEAAPMLRAFADELDAKADALDAKRTCNPGQDDRFDNRTSAADQEQGT